MKNPQNHFGISATILAAGLCLGLSGASPAQDNAADTKKVAETAPTLPTLWIIGDSTVKNGSKIQVGWGDPIGDYFDGKHIRVMNRARGGRSSRTYLTEGLWKDVLDQMQKGDFVLMQFGHNDGGSPRTSYRASLKGNGDETQNFVNPQSKVDEAIHSFGWYLRQYIANTKAKGATPIVLSLIPRNDWKDGKVMRSFPGYAQTAQEAAQQGGALFVDLNSITADKYDALGEEAVKAFFPDEHTHTNLKGAEVNAASVVAGLKGIHGLALNNYYSAKANDIAPYRIAASPDKAEHDKTTNQ